MVGDKFRGTDFLKREFRMLMDVVPPHGQFLDDRAGATVDVELECVRALLCGEGSGNEEQQGEGAAGA